MTADSQAGAVRGRRSSTIGVAVARCCRRRRRRRARAVRRPASPPRRRRRRGGGVRCGAHGRDATSAAPDAHRANARSSRVVERPISGVRRLAWVWAWVWRGRRVATRERDRRARAGRPTMRDMESSVSAPPWSTVDAHDDPRPAGLRPRRERWRTVHARRWRPLATLGGRHAERSRASRRLDARVHVELVEDVRQVRGRPSSG